MIKGVTKNMIEINNMDSEYFENYDFGLRFLYSGRILM